MLIHALLLCASLIGGEEPRPEDEVELKSGKKLAGYVLFEDDAKVVVRVGSREQEHERKNVARVRSANRTLATVIERLDALPAKEVAGRLDIAKFCADSALPGEANVIALTALSIDPQFAAAHEFLGHSKRASGWFVKRDSKNVAFEDLLVARKDFKDPWELRTTHFKVLTNASLADAVAVAIDMEREYHAFYAFLGPELGLYEVVEPMALGLYTDARSYPEGVSNRVAYFSPTLNQMFVNAEGGIDRYAIFHEGTHALLHNTAENTRGGRGVIPGWLHEGLAEYFANGYGGELGASTFSLGAEYPQHFVTHREAQKPYDLGRVLNFSSGDFHASSKVDLKYAQAYTLVHFALHGDNQAHRAGFLSFLKRAYLGDSSTTAFKDSMSLDERKFEKAWHAHVGRTR